MIESNSTLTVICDELFHQAVDKIPLMGYTTRIDRALRQAQKEFFTAANGGRKNVPKIIILLTDGTQSQDDDAEDPAKIAAELRGSGISTIVVGIGSGKSVIRLY